MPTYKLKELVTEVISGEWGQEPSDEFLGVKVIRTTNFSNTGRLDLHKEVVMREIEPEKVDKKKLQVGDIIIEKSGGSPEQPVGRVVFFEETGIYLCNNFTSILRPNKELVEPKYLMYLMFNLHKTRRVLKFQNKTTGIINLKLEQYLQQTEVAIPSKEIQQKIVNILDRTFDLINNRQSQIEALDELTHSVFLEMFGDPIQNIKDWPKEKLGQLCEVVRGGSPRPIQNYLGGNVPWIKIGDGTKGDNIYINNTKEFIDESGVSKSRIVEKGDIIFANCGVSLGFARIVNFRGCIHDGWLAFNNIDSRINKIFLLKLLNYYTDYFRKTAPDGTQPNLNTNIMKNFLAIIPPLELQVQFEKNIFELERVKNTILLSHNYYQDLYQSLLQKAFKGELFIEQIN